jgi:hypothetical protein
MGDMPRERLYFRPESYYRDNAIALRLGAVVRAIDCKRRVLQCDFGAFATAVCSPSMRSTTRRPMTGKRWTESGLSPAFSKRSGRSPGTKSGNAASGAVGINPSPASQLRGLAHL